MDRDELMIADGDRDADATYDSLEHIIRHEDLQKFVLFKTHFRKYMDMSDAYEDLIQRLDECEQQLELAQARGMKISSDLASTEAVLRERENALQRKEDELFAADERIAQLECELDDHIRNQQPTGAVPGASDGRRRRSRRLQNGGNFLPDDEPWRAADNDEGGSLCCTQCTEHPAPKSCNDHASSAGMAPQQATNALCRCVGCCYCCSSGWLQQECRTLRLERGELQLRCQVLKAQMGEELDAARCDNRRLNRALEIAERETEHWKRLWEHLRYKVQRLESEKAECLALQDLLRTGVEHLARCPAGAGPSLGLPPPSYSSCKLCARLRIAYARPSKNGNGKITVESRHDRGGKSRSTKQTKTAGLRKEHPEHQQKGILVDPSRPEPIHDGATGNIKEPHWSATLLLSKLKRKKSPSLCTRLKAMRQTKSFDCDELLKLSEWKGDSQNGCVGSRTSTLPRREKREIKMADGGDASSRKDTSRKDGPNNQGFSRQRGTRLTKSFGDWDRDDKTGDTPETVPDNNNKEYLEYDSAAAEKILRSVPYSSATTFTLSRDNNNDDDANPWLAATWLSTLRRSESKKSGESTGHYDTSLWPKPDFGGLQCPLEKGEPTDDLDSLSTDGPAGTQQPQLAPADVWPSAPSTSHDVKPSNPPQGNGDGRKHQLAPPVHAEAQQDTLPKPEEGASHDNDGSKYAKDETVHQQKHAQHSPMSFKRLFDRIVR